MGQGAEQAMNPAHLPVHVLQEALKEYIMNLNHHANFRGKVESWTQQQKKFNVSRVNFSKDKWNPGKMSLVIQIYEDSENHPTVSCWAY